MKILALVRNTVRELFAKATLIILAAISTLVILGTSLAVWGQMEALEKLSQTPGAQSGAQPTPEALELMVRTVQAGLAGGLSLGVVLFGIFATAGVVPDCLERGTVDLYLSKPLPRWELLVGKYLGAVVVVFFNILYFIGIMWLVFGLKMGIWNIQFLVSSLTMTYVFACMFSMVVLLGVLARNTAVPILISFLYIFIVGALLHNRVYTLYLWSDSTIFRTMVDGLYYLFPQLTGMQESIGKQIAGETMDWRPFVQSFLSSSVLFGGSIALLRRKDF